MSGRPTRRGVMASPWEPQHPIAVYGSLRPGCGNDGRWSGRAIHASGWTAPGFRLVGAGRPYPYVVRDPAATVVVDLVIPTGGDYLDVLEDLDWLEGHPTHYRREAVGVEGHGQFRLAWLYVPVNQLRVAGLETVDGGDWAAHLAATGSRWA